ncbi:MAG: VCBS repeat-containing protein [Phycisphaerales bacterium]|nr:VCBS repeat-containing protein [Phycisphaerales bacterium]
MFENRTTPFVPVLCVLLTLFQPSGADAQVCEDPLFSGRAFDIENRGDWAGLADFNGDGNLDIFTLSTRFSNDSATILFGDGRTNFDHRLDITLPFSAGLPIFADIDSDLDIDFLLRSGESEIVVYLNDSTGVFTPGLAIPTSVVPRDFKLSDINGDGTLDLVALYSTGPIGVSVSIGNGDGSFGEETHFPLDEAPISIEIGKLNNDATNDLFILMADSPTIIVMLNNGNGSFSTIVNPISTGRTQSNAILGDFDNDGDLDAITYSINETRFTLMRNFFGAGIFTEFENILLGVEIESARATDLDSDGDLDLVATTRSYFSIKTMINNGSGSYSTGPGSEGGVPTKGLALGHIDGDSNIDIVITPSPNNQVHVIRGDGQGNFGKRHNFYVADSQRIKELTSGDLNGDGLPDLIFGLESETGYSRRDAAISINQGNGIFSLENTSYLEGCSNTYDIEIGDLENDGDLDIVSANLDCGTLSVWHNVLGFGLFTDSVSQDNLNGAWDLELADLDGDGLLDIVSTMSEIDRVGVLTGRGSGLFDYRVWYFTKNTPREVEIADLDGDGDLDIVATNNTDPHTHEESLSILLNNGDATFADFITIPTIYEAANITFHDFNGDTLPDMVYTNYSEQVIAIMLNAGNAKFEQEIFLHTDHPRSLAVGNLNGDEFADIAVISPDPDSVSIFYGYGDAIFSEPIHHFSSILNPYDIVIDDFDLDGRMDLAISNLNTVATIMFNTGEGGCCPIDLNGDHSLDIDDIYEFIDLFQAQDPLANFHADENFDFFDISAFLRAFGAGCP